jgi:lipopolysaccharide export system protein LptA
MSGTVLVLLLLTLAAGGAEPPVREPVRLIRADKLRTIEVAGRSFRELEGAVHVRHRELDLFFDYGRYDALAGLLHCVSQVRAEEGGRTMTSDELSFDENQESARATGHVHAWGDSLESWSETALWLDGLQQGELRGNARLLDHGRQLELEAGEIHVDHGSGVYTALRSPVLTRLEEPPTVLSGLRLQWDRPSGRAWARGVARLVREDFRADCDSIAFDETTGIVEFHGEPVLRRETRRISGDVVLARIDGENRLDSLHVRGRARMESPADSVDTRLHDVLEGDEMALDFEQGEIRLVEVEGRARSVIFLKDERGRPGMNVADAARMDFRLEDGRLRTVAMGGGVAASWLPLSEPPVGPAPPEEAGAAEPAGDEAATGDGPPARDRPPVGDRLDRIPATGGGKDKDGR